MELHINATPHEVKTPPFQFGNIANRYGANSLYFTRDSAPFIPLSGEFHFSRYPRSEWRAELLKMRALGLNMVATYVFWNHHETKKGAFNFSGDRDIHAFLTVCREVGMPCVLRIGPWCHGEVVYGGFPRYVNRMRGKRKDSPRYLAAVRRFFTRLYKEVAAFLDGETVVGIQLENEYGGPISHIHTLRNMVEEIGYKTAFFTMTAWPTNTPDLRFLPMMGGYPEAPWTQHKHPLAPNNRFAISPYRTESEIGGDLVKSQDAKRGSFDEFPYAGCEVGPGNQVTQHRRPIISDKDGYGIAFAKFASGMNWMGYYMFHGGRNPNDGLYQESRRTGYPNNYPIIDYDFQAPLSRWGYARDSAHHLRLLHTFIESFDTSIAQKSAYFPTEQPKGPLDVRAPKCAVRMGADLSGYCFFTTYERGLPFPDFQDVQLFVETKADTITLPALDIPANTMFFFPFNLTLEGRLFQYITAQPIAKVDSAQQLDVYFKIHEGIAPTLCVNGQIIADILPDTVGYRFNASGKTVTLHFLSAWRAMDFYLLDGQVLFSNATLYQQNQKIIVQAKPGTYLEQADRHIPLGSDENLRGLVSFSATKKTTLPHAYDLYSHSRRRYYRLQIDPVMFDKCHDIELVFAFSGLNLQVFSGKTLVDDYFNTDGFYRLCLRQYRDILQNNPVLTIRTAAQTRVGIGKVYNEIALTYDNELQLQTVTPIQQAEF